MLTSVAVVATIGFVVWRVYGVTNAQLADVGAAGVIFTCAACGRSWWYALRMGDRFLLTLAVALISMICVWSILLWQARFGEQ